jgi:hypothetical protein
MQAQAKARANKTFIVLASLEIITYDHQNIFVEQATGGPLLVRLTFLSNVRQG